MAAATIAADPTAQRSFEAAKALLNTFDADGHSMYSHLYDTVFGMLEENPMDVAHHPDRFAAVSEIIRKQKFVYADPSVPTAAPLSVAKDVLDRAKSDAQLFEQPAPVVKTTVERPTPFTTITTTTTTPAAAPAFQSVQSLNKYWKSVGCGLMDQEALLLDLSISRLARVNKLEDVRFVGKIFGTNGNYLVVSSKRFVAEGEVVTEEANNMPKPPRKKVEVDMQTEPAYKGANRVSFWVAPNASADWVLLPDVTPQQINASRRFKKLLTGDLYAPVITYPIFPGEERHLLRAQLGRLVASTYVAPAGALEAVVPEEEEEEAVEDDDGKPKPPKPAKYWPATRVNKEFAPDEEAGVSAFTDLEQWQHSEQYIYETGRCTKVPPKPEVEGEEEQPPEEEEEEEEKKEEEEKELFGPLKKDSLFAVITAPKEPSPDGEEEEEEPPVEEENPEDGEKQEEEEKPLEDEDVPDDDPLRKKITAWTATTKNTLYKKHAIAVIRSLRWPGAVAFAADRGKTWACVYFGTGCKETDYAFTPAPAAPIVGEPADLTEVKDPTAANEKLVLRGEEPKEHDSEEEKEPEEEEEPVE